MNVPMTACPECDLLHRTGPLTKRETALCVRCGAVLKRGGHESLDVPLAFAIAALILFCLANAFPLMSMYMQGTSETVTLPGSIRSLATLGWPWLAAVLITTVELAPLAYLTGMIYVLLRVRTRRGTFWTARLFRLVQEFQSWAMVEVFLLAILVSYVRLNKMAVVVPGVSLYALALFILSVSAVPSSLQPEAVWKVLGARR